MNTDFRIGQGYDVHALTPGRKLILGGVEIPHSRGLLGHSDADALLHAITDALLGAAGLGDIGGMFPDTGVAVGRRRQPHTAARRDGAVRAAGWRSAMSMPRSSPRRRASRRTSRPCVPTLPPTSASIPARSTSRARPTSASDSKGAAKASPPRRWCCCSGIPAELEEPRSHRVFFALWPDANPHRTWRRWAQPGLGPVAGAMRPAIRCT
jgi:hypothetical protein